MGPGAGRAQGWHDFDIVLRAHRSAQHILLEVHTFCGACSHEDLVEGSVGPVQQKQKHLPRR